MTTAINEAIEKATMEIYARSASFTPRMIHEIIRKRLSPHMGREDDAVEGLRADLDECRELLQFLLFCEEPGMSTTGPLPPEIPGRRKVLEERAAEGDEEAAIALRVMDQIYKRHGITLSETEEEAHRE